MSKKCLIIVNPISGLGFGRRNAPRLQAALHASGCEADLFWTKTAGDARQAAANTNADEVSVIVSVGGDGTLNEIVNGVGDKGIPVAVFPVGTGNVLAKEYSIPCKVKDVCEMISRGKTALLDVGLIGRRRFVLFAGIGFDAAVAMTLYERRKGRICMLHYLSPTLRTFLHYPFPEIRVTVDGQATGTATTVLISNVQSYGGPFKFARGADPTDGAFDVLLLRGRSRWDVLRYFWGGLTRRILRYRDVTCLRGATIELTSDGEPPIQADGDYIGKVPAKIELLPARLPLIVP